MIKYLALCLVLLMSGALMACDDAAGQKEKSRIAAVDVARLMRDSVAGKEGVKFIEDRQKELQAKLDELQTRLEKNPEDQAIMQELQMVYAEAQQRMQTEGQAVANLIYDAVQRTLDAYRAKNGLEAILGVEALASFDPKIDITPAVLAEVDKVKLDFKAIPQAKMPEANPAPALAPQEKQDKAADGAKEEAKEAKPAAQEDKGAASGNDKAATQESGASDKDKGQDKKAQ